MSNSFILSFRDAVKSNTATRVRPNQVVNLSSGTKVERYIVPKGNEVLFPDNRGKGDWVIKQGNKIDLVTYGEKSKMSTKFGVDQVLKLYDKDKSVAKVAFLKEGRCAYVQNMVAQGKAASKSAIEPALKVLRNIK